MRRLGADIFCPLSSAEPDGTHFLCKGGSFCCSGIWKIGSSVRKTTIFRTSKWGPAWPAYPGVEAQGQWPHSQQRGCQQKNSVSRLADWPDCSGTHDVTKIAADELLKQPKVQAATSNKLNAAAATAPTAIAAQATPGYVASISVSAIVSLRSLVMAHRVTVR